MPFKIKEILLFTFFVNYLFIIMMIAFLNYDQTSDLLSKIYIFAEQNLTTKNEDNNTEQIRKDTNISIKDSNKEKTIEQKSNKNRNLTSAQLESLYRSFFPFKQVDIPEVYQTIPNGETYRFNITNPNDLIQVDERENEKIFTKQNNDGSWRIDFGRPRIDIHTKDAGILPDKSLLEVNMSNNLIKNWDYSDLKEIGYWYKPSDWKNIEITLIFKLLDSSRSEDDQHALSIVTRSITHGETYKKKSDTPFHCGGSSYHNNISNEGYLKMKKEQFHIDYEDERYNPNIHVGGDIYDKIIGFKAIVYNVNDTAVKLETWVDTENEGKGPYKKVHEKIDGGDWGDNMKICGAETDGQAITWGSPTVIIKANDFKFDIYDIEIREINPR